MRFVDIIMDIDWYNANAKSLGSPRARAKRRAIGHDIDVELLIYGDERKFRHLRVLIGSDNPQIADAVHSDNLDFWLSMYEIASATGQGTFSKPATIPGTDAYMVVSGHGDETAPGVSFDVSGVAVPTINYEAVETLTRSWDDTYRSELWFAARFLNPNLPIEVRWLNAYRVLEWHFEKGRGNLPHSKPWKDYLNKYNERLAPHLKDGQKLHGLIEEARATAAHAVIASRNSALPGHSLTLVTETFTCLEAIALNVLRKATGGKVAIERESRNIGPVRVSLGMPQRQ